MKEIIIETKRRQNRLESTKKANRETKAFVQYDQRMDRRLPAHVAFERREDQQIDRERIAVGFEQIDELLESPTTK